MNENILAFVWIVLLNAHGGPAMSEGRHDTALKLIHAVLTDADRANLRGIFHGSTSPTLEVAAAATGSRSSSSSSDSSSRSSSSNDSGSSSFDSEAQERSPPMQFAQITLGRTAAA